MLDSSARFVIGIDASNIREGGGMTHLKEMLGALLDLPRCVDRVVVWAERETIAKLPKRGWLHTETPLCLEGGGIFCRLYWQCLGLASEAKRHGCSVLLVPGGSYIGMFRPFVTMSRNMLPFDEVEMARYPIGKRRLRYKLLHLMQSYTFKRADGLVFLTRFAHDAVLGQVGDVRGEIAIIPHGVSSRFRTGARELRPIASYSDANPFVIVYVSRIARYKHQWHVAEAVAKVREANGWPLVVHFVGDVTDSECAARFDSARRRLDTEEVWCRHLGHASHEEMHELLEKADLAVFASSCENMPNILLEKMAAGLPIACSNRGPMPECLGGAGLLFDPEDPADIARQIELLVRDERRRHELGVAASQVAESFSWERCASETFGLLADVAKRT